MAAVRLDERFELELWASEPLVTSPVAMGWDAGGRALVVEAEAFPPPAGGGIRVRVLEDTDGDGKPDRQKALEPGAPLPPAIRDWREKAGKTTDESGRTFATDPGNHVQYEAVDSRLLARSRPLGIPSGFHSISDHGESTPLQPITENPVYPLLHDSNRSTSSSAIVALDGMGIEGLGSALLIAEPAHNLLHCDLVAESGATCTARRYREGPEFLASTDAWFRPVAFARGKDGTIYILDFYAPAAPPTSLLEAAAGTPEEQPWFRASGKGRIYRLKPRGPAATRPTAGLVRPAPPPHSAIAWFAGQEPDGEPATWDKLLLEHLEDPWIQAAALSAPGLRPEPLLARLAPRLPAEGTAGAALLVRRLGAMIVRGNEPGAARRLLLRALAPDPDWKRAALLEGLADGAGRGPAGIASAGEIARLADLAGRADGAVREAALRAITASAAPVLPLAAETARKLALLADAAGENVDRRRVAVAILGLAAPEVHRSLFEGLVSPRQPDAVQREALRSLSRTDPERFAGFALSKWRSLTYPIRRQALETILESESGTAILLSAVEKEEIAFWCLNDTDRMRILGMRQAALAARLHRLLEQRSPEKNSLLARYAAALETTGDRQEGEAVYRRLCARCHTVRGGSNYGPDLWSVSSRPPRRTLVDILMPSDAMAAGREVFMIDLRGGGSVDGAIGSENATSLFVLHDESRQETVLREQVERLLLSDASGMPVDLQTQITLREMASLLRFLTAR